MERLATLENEWKGLRGQTWAAVHAEAVASPIVFGLPQSRGDLDHLGAAAEAGGGGKGGGKGGGVVGAAATSSDSPAPIPVAILRQQTLAQMCTLGVALSTFGHEALRSSPALACECLQRALKLLPRGHPAHAFACARLGRLHWTARRPERALLHLRAAAAMDESTGAVARAHLRLLLCRVLCHLGDEGAALETALEADELLENFASQLQAAHTTARSVPARGVRAAVARRGRAARAALVTALPPALGLGLDTPLWLLCPGTCNEYGGRDHAPDVAPSATAGVEPVWRLRAIAKQSVCYCLEALGRHDDALHEAKAAAEMSILARSGGGGVLRAPAHVNETFLDVRLPSTTGALFMYKEAPPPLQPLRSCRGGARRAHLARAPLAAPGNT
jgi:tetratricopeptide (TPR) repeat protein